MICGYPKGGFTPGADGRVVPICIGDKGHSGEHTYAPTGARHTCSPGCADHGNYVLPERETQRSEVKPNEAQSQKSAAIEQARPQTPDDYELLTREILTVRHAIGKAIPLLSKITPKATAAEPAPTPSRRLVEAAQGILDIGKRDMTNPKYDGFFIELAEAVAEASALGAKEE